MGPAARLGIGDALPAPSVGLIDVADKPEGEAAHAVGRDHRIDAVCLIANRQGVLVDLLQKPGETPGGRPELSLPELAPGERDLGAKTELWRRLALGNAHELVGGLLRRVERGGDDLRIPDGMHDLEELAFVPDTLADGASPFVVGLHGRGAIATGEVERDTQEQA